MDEDFESEGEEWEDGFVEDGESDYDSGGNEFNDPKIQDVNLTLDPKEGEEDEAVEDLSPVDDASKPLRRASSCGVSKADRADAVDLHRAHLLGLVARGALCEV